MAEVNTPLPGAEGNGENQQNQPPANDPGTPPKTFTQDELNSFLAKERKKYANYAELKKAADELAELKKGQLSEADKLKADLAEKERVLAEMQNKVSAYELEKVKLAKLQAAGIGPEWTDSVPGSNEEEVEASVAKLAARLKAVPPVTPAGAQGAGNPGTPPVGNKKTWKRSEITKIASTADAATLQEINQAEAEGRIDYNS